MINSIVEDDRCREVAATERFLEAPNEESFTELFLTLTPQLVSDGAAARLGMKRTTLQSRMRKLNIARQYR